MSCYVYCLYSTEDGEPRYVGRATDKVSYRFRQHVTAALEQEAGPLYDWMRDIWRRGHDIAFYMLQEGIAPKDVDMFEQYWISQFSNLLNVVGNQGGKSDSKLANQVVAAIRAQLNSSRSP